MPSKKISGTERLRRRHINSPELIAALEQARKSARIARKIYELRTAAHLTQQELAGRIGTTASVLSRLENDDYEGHSLSMLYRIAAALGHTLEVEFVRSVGARSPLLTIEAQASASFGSIRLAAERFQDRQPSVVQAIGSWLTGIVTPAENATNTLPKGSECLAS